MDNLYDEYVKKICVNCKNKDLDSEDFCNIYMTMDGTTRCPNYERKITKEESTIGSKENFRKL